MLDILKINSVTAKQIPGISFSLRELLVHSNPGVEKWLSSYLVSIGVLPDEKSFFENWLQWRREYLESLTEAKLAGSSRELSLEIFANYLKMSAEQIGKMRELYRASVKLVYPQYIADALQLLKDREYRLFCLTNEEASVADFLKTFGLLDLFDAVIYAGTDTRPKPDSEAFKLLLEEADLAADQIIHIGGRFEIDAVGARAQGIAPFIYDPHSREINLLPDIEDYSQQKVVELNSAREHRLREGVRFFSRFEEVLNFFK